MQGSYNLAFPTQSNILHIMQPDKLPAATHSCSDSLSRSEVLLGWRGGCLQKGLRLLIGLLEGCGVERKLWAERISISVTAEGEVVEGI